jgi:CBS domain containing-hemolysin-like protein
MGDLLVAISVLLVFLTLFFNAIEKQVSEKVQLQKPEKEQVIKRQKYISELYKLLFVKTIPITLIFLITAYILLPKAVKIVITSNFNLWHFDELNTIFVFIVIGFWGLTVYAIIKTIQLISKIRE